jgi:hypothetical protein
MSSVSKAKVRRKPKLWVGIVSGNIHFYLDLDYKVWRADLFRTKREAQKCYEEVRPLTKRETGR